MHLLAAHINERSQRIQKGKGGRSHILKGVDGGVRSLMAFWKRQIFPTGKPTRASPKCAEVRHQNQSTLRAQRSIGHNGHAAPDVAHRQAIKFMVRKQVLKELEATLG
jgi:hypothetical protein